jgi:glycosyltransferase involved in cell wall biosynthesis
MLGERRVETDGLGFCDAAVNGQELEGVRIILVLSTFILGGAERQALLLARYLVGAGADVEVWARGEPGRVSELCDEHGIRWRIAPIPELPWPRGPFEQFKRLAKFGLALRRSRPEVVLPFMFFPSVACGLVWRLSGARLCVWNQRDEGRDRIGPITEKLAVRLTPRFVANSGLGAEFLIKTLGANQNRVEIIYNGVALNAPEWDRIAWRKQIGVSDECFLACMVANLQEFKDHATLLKAWRIVLEGLRTRNRDGVLLLAGSFLGTEQTLKALAYDLRLGSSVRFLGGVKDIAGLLSAVDLGVHSSVNEGIPNGVLECMASGLAVTGTDYPGIREALGEQGGRFLSPPRDPAALARQMLALALDPHVRYEAGIANQIRARTEFSPWQMYRKTSSLIVRDLEREKPRVSRQNGR